MITGGTSEKGVILCEKRSRKYRIKIFRLRLCFRENRLIIGPYFFEENVTSAAYFDFLQNQLPELLEDVPLRTRGSLIFQQDGAPPHFIRHVRDFLNQHYQGWIGRAGTIAWPPRSLS